MKNSKPSLFDFLALIERRPGMYVRADDREHSPQLDDLEMLIRGYCIAVDQHEVPDSGVDTYSGFSEYLAQRYGWSMSQGPIKAIRHASASEAEAWQSFWRMLREFRQSRGGGNG